MTNLVLTITLLAVLPSAPFIGRGTNNIPRWIVSSNLCETVEFRSEIRTNGTYVLQIADNLTNGAWTRFGSPITGPATNVQTLAVPRSMRFYRHQQLN